MASSLEPPPTPVDVAAKALCNRPLGDCLCREGGAAEGCEAAARFGKSALRVVSGLRAAGLFKDGI